MPSTPKSAGSPLVTILNAAVNLFWTILCVAPAYLFCARHITLKTLYILLATSLLPYFLPRSAFRHVQLSRSLATYRQLGVPFINHFAQDGKLVNRIARKQRPSRPNATALQQMETNTYTRERFHLAGLIVFACLTAAAIIQHEPIWAALLLATNILYNAYPSLLQQYIRLRLQPLQRRLAR